MGTNPTCVTNPTKTWGELMWSGRIGCPWSIIGTRRVTNKTIRGVDIKTNRTYPWSLVTQTLRNGHSSDRKITYT